MQSSQQHIIESVSSWLDKPEPVWLCTILKTWGSSPRPVGAMLACSVGGELVGSLSGGCIEEDFLEQLRDGSLKARYDSEGGPFVIEYGATEAEQAHIQYENMKGQIQNQKRSTVQRTLFARFLLEAVNDQRCPLIEG